MKTSFSLALLSLSLVGAHADTVGTQTSQTGVNQKEPPPAYQVVERGANHRVWQRTIIEQGPHGKSLSRIHKYTELGTGLSYLKNGQWADSKEEIDIQSDGTAAATQGQHQAYFPGDIYQGVIKLVTPDGLQQQSRPLGLFYDDGQNTVMIAQLQGSSGGTLDANQVIYANAFAGVQADLLYTYRKSGFEQDIVLRQQPPSPETYGLNPQTTKMEVLTEFFDNNVPVQTASPVNPQDGLSDTTLAFGTMKMVHGRAFSTGDDNQPASLIKGIPTYKSWVNLNGRTFLIEAVPYQRIAPQLEQLPAPPALPPANPGSPLLNKVSPQRSLPPVRMAQAGTNAVRFASAKLNRKSGVVLDYDEIDAGQTNFTFQADLTYFVGGEYNLVGTTTFEGGTVIKYNGRGMIDIDESGTINCQTGPYRPAIFTSVNDDYMGEPLGGSSGTPAFGDVFVFLRTTAPNITLRNMRFSYCDWGVYQYSSPATLDIWDCQFMNVDAAILGYNVGLHNVLIDGSAEGDSSVYVEGPSLIAENVTADEPNDYGAYFVEMDYSGAGTVAFTNCLATGQYDLSWGAVNVITNGTVFLPFPAGPVYQTVGAASYYLTNGSPYRNAGTTNISPALLAELKQKTTYPPIVYDGNTITSPTTLNPQAQRDTNSSLDLGYHYDALDYAFAGCDLYTSLTLTAGTAVAYVEDYGGVYSSGQPYALSLNDGANFTSIGTATAPCWFVNNKSVMEGGNGNWTTRGWMSGMMFNGSGSDPIPQINSQWTKFPSVTSDVGACRDNWADGVGRFANCELYNNGMGCMWPSYYYTNCLFMRSGVVLYSQIDAESLTLQNCTFYGGFLGLCRFSGQSTSYWTVKNTAFDGVLNVFFTDDLNGDTNYTAFDYNAFQNITNILENVGPHDQTNIVNFNWQSSWLGNYYLPLGSPLIDAGSTTADQVGLYHFTTQINQVKETNSIVDIGYHYVATDGYGNPLDSNGDGIPDYIEDVNGNGIDDPGETPWNFTSTGLKLWLRADAGITISSGNQISTWADQSGNANDATQVNTYDQPLLVTNVINSLPAVWFSGTNNMNSGYTNSYFNLPNTLLTGATGAEAFVVLKVPTDHPTYRQSLWEMGGAPLGGKSFPDHDGIVKDDFGSTTVQSLGTPAVTLDEFNVYEVSSQTNSWQAWFNGILAYQTNVNAVAFPTTAPFPDLGWYALGGSPYIDGLPYYFAGEITEVMVFNRVLTDDERVMVNDYLNDKYGLMPTVTMTNPTNSALFVTGSNVGLAASASEVGGTIKQVEFFQGSTSLGVDTSSPYSMTWSNVAAGSLVATNFILTARVTGDNGLVATSTVVNIYVDPPPTVSITNPVNNAYLGPTPANVAISVTASDVTGIRQVQFFQGTNSLGIITSSPYNLTWSSVAAGSYSLTAVATGNDGLTTTSSAINITIDNDADGDGLGDQQEYLYGTNPNVSEGFWLWVSTPNGLSGIP